MKGGEPMLEIRLPRQTLFLTEKELTSLLAKDPNLWKLALRRGKGILRQRQAGARVPRHLKKADRQLVKEVADVCHLEP